MRSSTGMMTFLISCWVIDEPPCTAPPCRLETKARNRPRTLMPGFSQKLRSSSATAAFHTHGDISSSGNEACGRRERGAGPRSRRAGACRCGHRCARSGTHPAAVRSRWHRAVVRRMSCRRRPRVATTMPATGRRVTTVKSRTTSSAWPMRSQSGACWRARAFTLAAGHQDVVVSIESIHDCVRHAAPDAQAARGTHQ